MGVSIAKFTNIAILQILLEYFMIGNFYRKVGLIEN